MELGSMIMFRSVYTKPSEIDANFHWFCTHFVDIRIMESLHCPTLIPTRIPMIPMMTPMQSTMEISYKTTLLVQISMSNWLQYTYTSNRNWNKN